jgi:hypothetical protein
VSRLQGLANIINERGSDTYSFEDKVASFTKNRKPEGWGRLSGYLIASHSVLYSYDWSVLIGAVYDKATLNSYSRSREAMPVLGTNNRIMREQQELSGAFRWYVRWGF